LRLQLVEIDHAEERIMMISTSASFHWVKKVTAETNSDGVLKLIVHGDPDVSDCQFNQAEILIFTEDAAMVDRLVKAINRVSTETA
jgi:hypothetical protein